MFIFKCFIDCSIRSFSLLDMFLFEGVMPKHFRCCRRHQIIRKIHIDVHNINEHGRKLFKIRACLFITHRNFVVTWYNTQTYTTLVLVICYKFVHLDMIVFFHYILQLSNHQPSLNCFNKHKQEKEKNKNNSNNYIYKMTFEILKECTGMSTVTRVMYGGNFLSFRNYEISSNCCYGRTKT